MAVPAHFASSHSGTDMLRLPVDNPRLGPAVLMLPEEAPPGQQNAVAYLIPRGWEGGGSAQERPKRPVSLSKGELSKEGTRSKLQVRTGSLSRRLVVQLVEKLGTSLGRACQVLLKASMELCGLLRGTRPLMRNFARWISSRCSLDVTDSA
eukprot:Skav221505  [mRNA]  locus=scaffold2743:140923:151951:+ [translate_table: standard]